MNHDNTRFLILLSLARCAAHHYARFLDTFRGARFEGYFEDLPPDHMNGGKPGKFPSLVGTIPHMTGNGGVWPASSENTPNDDDARDDLGSYARACSRANKRDGWTAPDIAGLRAVK